MNNRLNTMFPENDAALLLDAFKYVFQGTDTDTVSISIDSSGDRFGLSMYRHEIEETKYRKPLYVVLDRMRESGIIRLLSSENKDND